MKQIQEAIGSLLPEQLEELSILLATSIEEADHLVTANKLLGDLGHSEFTAFCSIVRVALAGFATNPPRISGAEICADKLGESDESSAV